MVEFILIGIFLSLTLLYASWILIYLRPKRKQKQVKYSPGLSIILPAHNEEEVIEDTLQSIVDADYPNKKEIIVLNDGSTDKTKEKVRKMIKLYLWVTFIGFILNFFASDGWSMLWENLG